jgi:cyanophycinase
MAARRKTGSLLVIGGAEDKQGNQEILKHVAERAGRGPLVVMTCATEDPAAAFAKYRDVFHELGVADVDHVDVRDRSMALDHEVGKPIDKAKAVFFTGGDQLRITSHIGDTPVYTRIIELVERGGMVAGTSAGAAVMSETMLVDGASGNTPLVSDIARMAPGLGLLPGVVVDMHFSERGRMGRLLGAIAQNPRILGVGIDEDTAMLVEGTVLTVLGSGGIYIVDGRFAGGSNVAEGSGDEALAIENVTLHLLNANRRFDLAQRSPVPWPERESGKAAA